MIRESKIGNEILNIDGESKNDLMFGLRIKYVSFPEDLTVVWVIFACIYKDMTNVQLLLEDKDNNKNEDF